MFWRFLKWHLDHSAEECRWCFWRAFAIPFWRRFRSPATSRGASSGAAPRPGSIVILCYIMLSLYPDIIYIIFFEDVYIYLENRMDIFFVHCGFFPWRTFFVQLRILVFDCEGLFKSFDNTLFGHPPTVSKRGISVQSGANWESWSGTHIWPQILPYFPPNLDVPIKYQYFFNIMWIRMKLW